MINEHTNVTNLIYYVNLDVLKLYIILYKPSDNSKIKIIITQYYK